MPTRCAFFLLLPGLGLLPACGCGPLPQTPDAGESDGGEEDAGAVVVPVAAVRIFFTDLQSGPNSGGEGNLGAFVTLYGRGFGAAQGGSTVTVGGGAVAGYPLWSDSKVTVQLGAAAATGEVVATVPGLGASNGVPFAVRPGELYFVATSGNDTAVGSRAQPWRTLVKARQALAPGDIAYVMSGVTAAAVDSYGAAVAVMSSGSAGRPKALVAYPGARPVIGRVGGAPEIGLRTPNLGGGAFSHWVVAGFKLQGVEAMSLYGADDWRVVGNELTCPLGNGATGCFSTSGATNLKFLGNEVHGAGLNGASKLYHSVYFSSDSNHVEVGWNHVHDNASCRGIQFHSSPLCVPSCGAGDTTGFNQFDLSVHDNRVHGQVCDGINFATVDPSKGKVEAYNNVIWDVGRGPDPYDGAAGYAGVYVAGVTNSGPGGSGTVELFNNTLYDCGARGGGGAGAFAVGAGSSVRVRLRNNIASAARAGEAYLTAGSPAERLEGSNNLWFGAGAGPAFLTGNVEADPAFANPAAEDFHLAPGSAAVNAGVPTSAVLDFDGVARPQGSEFDLGAFEAAP